MFESGFACFNVGLRVVICLSVGYVFECRFVNKRDKIQSS